MQAYEIFKSSKRNAVKVVLILTDGSFEQRVTFVTEPRKKLIDDGAIVYSIATGFWSETQTRQDIIKDLATDEDHFAKEAELVEAILNTQPVLGKIPCSTTAENDPPCMTKLSL